MGFHPSIELDTARSRVPLDGAWEFCYDPGDVGVREGWYGVGHRLPERIAVPGCAQAQPFASAGPVANEYQGLPELADQVMLRYPSRDVSWYARSFTAPAAWAGQAVWLHLGGVKPAATVWLNGAPLGQTTASRCPVRCDLTPYLRVGEENRLVIRVDWPEPGFFGLYDILSAWSGLYRSAWVEAVPRAALEDVHVRTAIAPPGTRIRVALGSVGDGPVRVTCESGPYGASAIVPAGATEVVFDLPMPGAALWSPDDPHLHQLTVRAWEGDVLRDEAVLRIGLRTVAVEGHRVLLNGRPIFLRGGCDDQYFPETVCPPATQDFYLPRLRKMRDYGFNYTKSCVEPFPRAFLDAADKVGLLVCQEMPLLTRNGLRAFPDGLPEEQRAFMRRAVTDIIRAGRNHPSVIVYSMSSELSGDWHDNPHHFRLFSQELPAVARAANPDALIFDATGVSTGGPAMGERAVPLATPHGRRDTDLDGSWLRWVDDCRPLAGPIPGLEAVEAPFIFHEFAWITELSDPALLDRYAKLPVRPLHVPEMLAAAEAHGQAALLPAMLAASHRLKVALRKQAFELARKAPQAAGYHHWLIHDFPFCAEGVFNEFYEAPADLPPAAMRAYNGDTVLCLEHGPRWSLAWGEPWRLALTVSHFGLALAEPVIEWTLDRAQGKVSLAPLAPGTLVTTDPLPLPLLMHEQPAALTLAAALYDGQREITRNRWTLWAFPEVDLPTGDVLVTAHLDETALARLAAGGRVLFVSPGGEASESGDLPRAPGRPLYRSVPYNQGEEGTMGTLVRAHPALGGFPHDGWCDFAWAPLLDGARPLDLKALPVPVDPIIRAIGHMRTLRDMAYLVELEVGRGRLLAGAMHLPDDDPAARYLRASLLAYLYGPRLQPAPRVTASQLEASVFSPSR
jgi:hypothetical protein